MGRVTGYTKYELVSSWHTILMPVPDERVSMKNLGSDSAIVLGLWAMVVPVIRDLLCGMQMPSLRTQHRDVVGEIAVTM